MGMTKRYLEESERPGFGLDKYVCLNCINDSALKRQVRKKASHTVCDYCHHHSKVPDAIEISDLLEIIIEGIEYEWERANN